MKRFSYHFEPQKGWMNDPNGLVFFQGKYHAFFQHYPYDTKWGPMHWGHAVSEDLIHWTQLENALVPEEPYEDAGGCFSGSAIVKGDTLYLIYTSVSREYGQAQSIAFSTDGIHFTRFAGNPVIRHYPIPDATADFRDPKVIHWKDEYRMILGTCQNGKGRVLSYGSKDLLNWEYLGILYESREYNAPVECPDLFKIGDQWILMYSKIGNPGYQTQFILGDYDGFHFTPEQYCSPEAGPQFYAPQSFEDPQGRRILIGWFYDWTLKCPEGHESAGALSIPRELSLSSDGELLSYPVQEAQPLLKTLQPASDPLDFSENLTSISGVSVHMDSEHVQITHEASGQNLNYYGKIHQLDLLEDEKAVEVFVNHGQHCFSIHPNNA